MEVIHLASQGNRSYVGEFIKKEFSAVTHKKFNRYIQRLKKYGVEPLRRAGNVVKLRGFELYELIVDYCRIFFVIRREVCYLVHAFKKKRNDTPIKEIQTALNRIKALDAMLEKEAI